MGKTSSHTSKGRLSLNVRLIIGIVSLPSFILCCMIVATALAGDGASIDLFEVVYSAVGIFGLYIALTGKRFF